MTEPPPSPDRSSSTATKRWSLAFKLIVTALLVGYLGSTVDVAQLGTAAGRIDLTSFLLSCAVVAPAELVVAARLRLLMRPMGLALPIPRLYRIGLIAKFYGLFLPAGLGHGLARWYKVTENRRGRIQFAIVTVFEKATFLLAVTLFVLIPLAAADDPRVEHVRVAALPITAAIVVIVASMVVLLFLGTPFAPVERLAQRIAGRTQSPLVRRAAGAVAALQLFKGESTVILGSLAAAMVMVVLVVVRLALLFVAVHVTLPVATLVWVATLAYALQVLPISLAGIGVREAVFAYAFTLFGLEPELGVLVGVLLFSQVVALAVIGWILEMWDRGHRPELDRAT